MDNSAPHTVILLRHGESEWNASNRFCGWVDVDLSPLGRKEAEEAGRQLANSGVQVDLAYTSLLTRANNTLDIVLSQMDKQELQVTRDWRLNERHYGALTGLNKADCVERWGQEQVQVWRRSFSVPPAPMEDNHPFYQRIVQQPVFVGHLTHDQVPRMESLEDLIARTIPFWTSQVEPQILSGKTVLVVAHGTSLRGIVKHIEGISDEAVCKLNLPTGIPIMYRLSPSLHPLGERQYLADEETVRKAVEKVAKIAPNPKNN